MGNGNAFSPASAPFPISLPDSGCCPGHPALPQLTPHLPPRSRKPARSRSRRVFALWLWCARPRHRAALRRRAPPTGCARSPLDSEPEFCRRVRRALNAAPRPAGCEVRGASGGCFDLGAPPSECLGKRLAGVSAAARARARPEGPYGFARIHAACTYRRRRRPRGPGLSGAARFRRPRHGADRPGGPMPARAARPTYRAGR